MSPRSSVSPGRDGLCSLYNGYTIGCIIAVRTPVNGGTNLPLPSKLQQNVIFVSSVVIHDLYYNYCLIITFNVKMKWQFHVENFDE